MSFKDLDNDQAKLFYESLKRNDGDFMDCMVDLNPPQQKKGAKGKSKPKPKNFAPGAENLDPEDEVGDDNPDGTTGETQQADEQQKAEMP